MSTDNLPTNRPDHSSLPGLEMAEAGAKAARLLGQDSAEYTDNVIHIVQATEADLEPVTDLMETVYADTYPNDRGIRRDMFEDNVSFREHLQEYLVKQLTDPDKKLLMAKNGDEVVGTIGLAMSDTGKEAEVWGFYVAPNQQGQGVGRQLWEELTTDERLAGLDKLTLTVAKDSAKAKAFYEANGFTVIGEEEWDWPHWTDEKLKNQYWTMEKSLVETKPPQPPLFPDLAGYEKRVKPGEYDLISGNKQPIVYHGNSLGRIDVSDQGLSVMQGVRQRGTYTDADSKSWPVVSFLYHKQDTEGNFETVERVIAWKGIGFGEHTDHVGQDPSWYLVGPQLGTFSHETRRFTPAAQEGETVGCKNFSIACIDGGPLGEPVLANPAR